MALTEESASEVEQQQLNIKNINKRVHGQSSLMYEDSDSSCNEGKELINFFMIAYLFYF